MISRCTFTCLISKGMDKVHGLDCKDFDGGIVADIEDAMRFIERNTRAAWKIEAIQRQDIPESPMTALREAAVLVTIQPRSAPASRAPSPAPLAGRALPRRRPDPRVRGSPDSRASRLRL